MEHSHLELNFGKRVKLSALLYVPPTLHTNSQWMNGLRGPIDTLTFVVTRKILISLPRFKSQPSSQSPREFVFLY
jgi:hypothetical protein